MKALSVSERLKIVQLLLGGPRSVTELAVELKDAVPNTSHHLRILQTAGLLRTERRGKFIFYSLDPKVHKKASACDTLEFGCCRVELGKAGKAAAMASER
jgi:DNA-binding transcriptional ArsR family regulator